MAVDLRGQAPTFLPTPFVCLTVSAVLIGGSVRLCFQTWKISGANCAQKRPQRLKSVAYHPETQLSHRQLVLTCIICLRKRLACSTYWIHSFITARDSYAYVISKWAPGRTTPSYLMISLNASDRMENNVWCSKSKRICSYSRNGADCLIALRQLFVVLVAWLSAIFRSL